MRRVLPRPLCRAVWRPFSGVSEGAVGRDVSLSESLISGSSLGEYGADAGKFMEIKEAATASLFPRGLPEDSMGYLTRSDGRLALMVRSPALQVIQALRAVSDKEGGAAGESEAAELPPYHVLTSDFRGVGKSLSLAHAVHWARDQGWVVLFVTDSLEFVQGGHWVQPSPYVEGMFDQPQVAHAVLEEFHAIHGEAVASLPVQTDEAKAHFSSATTLGELMQAGLADQDAASQAVADLRLELGAQTDLPFLLAIDNVDLLYRNTEYHHDMRKLDPAEMTLLHGLRDLSKDGELIPGREIQNGRLVVATTRRYQNVPEDKRLSTDQACHVDVEPFSMEELKQLVAYCTHEGLIEPKPDAEVNLCRVQSQSIPKLVMERLVLG